jgi:hypothetical protein
MRMESQAGTVEAIAAADNWQGWAGGGVLSGALADDLEDQRTRCFGTSEI